jgi:thiamine phosphate synthase YjbQ (UPF0047 family)
MKQATSRLSVPTRGKGLYEFTGEVERWVEEQGLSTGLLTIWVKHTSASLTVQLVDGRLTLGTWQGIYLFEHRSGPHTRSVVLHLMGDEC